MFQCVHRRGIEVGFDAIHVTPDTDDVVASCVSRREVDTCLALDSRDKPVGHYGCWERKLALLEVLGAGHYHPTERFEVRGAPGEPATIFYAENEREKDYGRRPESSSLVRGLVVTPTIERGWRRAVSVASSPPPVCPTSTT